MASRWLKEITDIAGVEGVLLVSNKGNIVDKIGTNFDYYTQKNIALHILRIISGYNLVQKSVKEIELIWYNYRVLAMSSRFFVLIIFCGSTNALSLLRITVNVVMAHLLEDRKAMKKINKKSPDDTEILDNSSLDQLEINLISKLQ
jgi:hypothetical protein